MPQLDDGSVRFSSPARPQVLEDEYDYFVLEDQPSCPSRFWYHSDAEFSENLDRLLTSSSTRSLRVSNSKSTHDMVSHYEDNEFCKRIRVHLVDDNRSSVNETPAGDHFWMVSQKCANRSPKLASVAGRENTANILDYSDPWGQIGVILGLQKDASSLAKIDQMTHTIQQGHEEKITELLAASDDSPLPPSDIPLDDVYDDSLDDALFAPSSLPVAESSEAMKVSLRKDGDHDFVLQDLDVSELILDDIVNDSGQDQFHGFCFDKPSFEILPLSDPAGGEDAGKKDANEPQFADAGKETADQPKFAEVSVEADTILDVHVDCHDSNPPVQKEDSLHLLGDFSSQSTSASSAPNHGDGDYAHSQTLLAPMAVSPNHEQPELKELLHNDSQWSADGDVCGQKGNVSCDMLDGCVDSTTNITGMINHNESVLAAPELRECDGVYQGPCLLSEESDCSDLEE
jgi:hypothetical protein